MTNQPPDADGHSPPEAEPNGHPGAGDVPLAVRAPRMLAYRSRRDEARSRHRKRRGSRRVSKAGLTGLVAAGLLAVVAGVAFVTSLFHHHAGRGVGPAGTVCIAFPLSYVAVMCGVMGCLPRGQDPLFGRCALVLTGVSWALYGVAFALAAG